MQAARQEGEFESAQTFMEWSATFLKFITTTSKLDRRAEHLVRSRRQLSCARFCDTGESESDAEATQLIPKKLNRAILADCSARHDWSQYWAFDGRKNLYSPEKLFDQNVTNFAVDISERGRERRFDVKVSLAATLRSSDVQRYLQLGDIKMPHSLIAALEICLKASFENDPRCICYGRSIFFNDQQQTRQDLPGGSEVIFTRIEVWNKLLCLRSWSRGTFKVCA